MDSTFKKYLKEFYDLQSWFLLNCECKIIPSHGFILFGNQSSKRIDLTISMLVHGNEPGGLYAVVEFLKYLKSQPQPFSKNLAIVFGHPIAAMQNKRFIQKDLNRAFGDHENITIEDQIAMSLERVLRNSNFVIDLHQTAQDSESDFFIFAFTSASAKWALNLSSTSYNIVHGKEFSKDGMTLDTYACLHGAIALTYEMGEIGYCENQIAKTKEILIKSTEASLDEYHSNHLIELKKFLSWSQILYADTNAKLKPGLKNFSTVSAGDIIAENDSGPIRANTDGYILFPKYGEATQTSSEICRLVSWASETGIAH